MVGYDLNRPHQDYDDLIKAIRTYSRFWHYLDSTWIIKTDDSSSAIRDNLAKHIDGNDELLVAKLSGAWASQGFEDKANQWLKSNL